MLSKQNIRVLRYNVLVIKGNHTIHKNSNLEIISVKTRSTCTQGQKSTNNAIHELLTPPSGY